MELSLAVMEGYLERAIEQFDTTPLATQFLRRLASESPDLFLTAALKRLETSEQSDAYRMLSILVLRREELLRRISSPAHTSKTSAVNLFRRFLKIDPSFDVKLARKLPGRSYWAQDEAFDSDLSARALEILDETSRGRRLLPILSHLPESADRKVSEKATLFVGRRVQNPDWTARQLARPDQRIRANAVEALWGLNTVPAVRLMERCLFDRNNRVVGNSIVGLHLAGKPGIDREVMTMSRSGKEELRSTAAWAMGKMGLPPFFDRLTEMIRDEHPRVRGRAIRSLLEMRRAEPRVPETGVTELPPAAGEAAVKRAEDLMRRPEPLPVQRPAAGSGAGLWTGSVVIHR